MPGRLVLAEPPARAGAGDAGTSGDADFQTTGMLYPITITSIENFVDADGNPVNLAGSADTVIVVE